VLNTSALGVLDGFSSAPVKVLGKGASPKLSIAKK